MIVKGGIYDEVFPRTSAKHPADFVATSNGIPERAEGIVKGAHRGRKKGALPEVAGGRNPGHHRGHLVPENYVEEPKLFNIKNNLISEAPRSNLSVKKRFENLLKSITAENPGAVIRFISVPKRRPGQVVPFAVSHYITVDGVVK